MTVLGMFAQCCANIREDMTYVLSSWQYVRRAIFAVCLAGGRTGNGDRYGPENSWLTNIMIGIAIDGDKEGEVHILKQV